ncbi:MAG: type II toxin-antitoxin system RelE/ParE family toxin [Gemmataceae bacterium]
MSVTVEFHRLAAAELVAARRLYRRAGPAAEARFMAAVRAAVGRIETFPAAGSPSVGSCRWVRVPRYRYLLHYRPISPDVYEVVSVAHSSRRPGYWVRRTRRP